MTSRPLLKHFALAATLLAVASPALSQKKDPIMDEGFDEHGVKTIQYNEGEFDVPVINVNMTAYDSADRGIPDAVMKLAGLPLDTDTETKLGGISLRDRYRWGLSITDESTVGDGITDLVKMRPPGWNDIDRNSNVFFTFTEEGVAEATPVAEGDHVFIPALGDYETTWEPMAISLGDFRFPLGNRYQPGPVHISGYGALEFGKARQNYYSSDLPTPKLSGDAVAVAWVFWEPKKPNPNTQIVAGFRGAQRGQRYFFTRWEKMDYAMLYDKPLATFEGRLYEDGRVEFHYLEGDFSNPKLFSGAQCQQGFYGLTVPQDKMVAGKKITFTPHYALDPLDGNMMHDGIPDAWKVRYNINPHDENAATMIFNDKGLTLRECFEQRVNPWTGVK